MDPAPSPLEQHASNTTIFRGFCTIRFYQRTPGCQPDPWGNRFGKPLFYKGSLTHSSGLPGQVDRETRVDRGDRLHYTKQARTVQNSAAKRCSSFHGTAIFRLQRRTINTQRFAFELHCNWCRPIWNDGTQSVRSWANPRKLALGYDKTCVTVKRPDCISRPGGSRGRGRGRGREVQALMAQRSGR